MRNTTPLVVETALRQLAKQTRAAARKFTDAGLAFSLWGASIEPSIRACVDMLSEAEASIRRARQNGSDVAFAEAEFLRISGEVAVVIGDGVASAQSCNGWSTWSTPRLRSLKSNIAVATADTSTNIDIRALADMLASLANVPALPAAPSRPHWPPSASLLKRTNIELTHSINGVAALFQLRSHVSEEMARLLDSRAARACHFKLTYAGVPRYVADMTALAKAGKQLAALDPTHAFFGKEKKT